MNSIELKNQVLSQNYPVKTTILRRQWNEFDGNTFCEIKISLRKKWKQNNDSMPDVIEFTMTGSSGQIVTAESAEGQALLSFQDYLENAPQERLDLMDYHERYFSLEDAAKRLINESGEPFWGQEVTEQLTLTIVQDADGFRVLSDEEAKNKILLAQFDADDKQVIEEDLVFTVDSCGCIHDTLLQFFPEVKGLETFHLNETELPNDVFEQIVKLFDLEK